MILTLHLCTKMIHGTTIPLEEILGEERLGVGRRWVDLQWEDRLGVDHLGEETCQWHSLLGTLLLSQTGEDHRCLSTIFLGTRTLTTMASLMSGNNLNIILKLPWLQLECLKMDGMSQMVGIGALIQTRIKKTENGIELTITGATGTLGNSHSNLALSHRLSGLLQWNITKLQSETGTEMVTLTLMMKEFNKPLVKDPHRPGNSQRRLMLNQRRITLNQHRITLNQHRLTLSQLIRPTLSQHRLTLSQLLFEIGMEMERLMLMIIQ
jgi:hypothetical protein